MNPKDVAEAELGEILYNLANFYTKLGREGYKLDGTDYEGCEQAKQKLRAWGLGERRIELAALMFADLPSSIKDALAPYLKLRDQELAADIEFGHLDQAQLETEGK